jgi:hypothetical protein
MLLFVGRRTSIASDRLNKFHFALVKLIAEHETVVCNTPPITRRNWMGRNYDVTPSQPETANELIDHPRRIGAFAIAIAAQHAE